MIPGAHRRLMLSYLGIIMVISMAFSIALYEVSSRTIGFSLQNQERAIFVDGVLVRPPANKLQDIRSIELERVRNNLLLRLVVLNLGMLVVGAWLSEHLAKRSLQPLEEALEAQARFTSDAAHELRTPLTAMKTEIEVALRSLPLKSGEVQELLESNLEEINKLDTLTGALLRLAKIDGTDNRLERVRIAEALADAARRVQGLAAAKDITFAIEPTKLAVRGDKAQLSELFYILFENAIKYGTPQTTVRVTAKKQNNATQVAVTDQGIGVKASDLPHIFDRFYRADQSRSKTKVDGYGLGLSLAQHIVKAHQGEITAASQPNKGSTFTVTLPFTQNQKRES